MTGIIEHPTWPMSRDDKLTESLYEDWAADLTAASTLDGSQKDIATVCDEVKALLLEKNRKYGDSALNPIRVFSKTDAFEQIKVRMDDKLNRIKNAQDDEDEDVIFDLLGYLVLYRVAKLQAQRNAR